MCARVSACVGMHIEASRNNKTAVDRLVTKIGAAARLIRRVSTRHNGMKEASLLRLLQSFAMSHVAYVGAFHFWLRQERDRINAAIRKAYRTALGLLNSTSTARLLELGVHNTLEEISEAQRTAQLERLATTSSGRRILERLGLAGTSSQQNETAKQQQRQQLQPEVMGRLRILPLPRNVHPDRNRGRREARARALAATYANDTGALYVDAARYTDRPDAYVAVAVRATTGEIYSACSVRVPSARQAEETAIALALTDPQCTTVVSDSRSAIANYATNNVCESAVRAVKCSAVISGAVPATHLRWFPAHTSIRGNVGDGLPNRNETADAAARGLTNRAAAVSSPLPSSATEGGQREDNDDEDDNDDVEWDPEPLLTYGEVLEWYRLGRRTAPAPHPKLTRQQAVLLRQLQTQSVITPALARHVCPDVYASDVCSVCGQHRATLAHILWDCAVHPVEAADLYGRLPDTITSAVYSTDLDAQTLAVQQLEAALARQKRSESQTGGKGTNSRVPFAHRSRRRRRGLVPKTS